MRVVLTAFEARPGVGTEAGLAWNWGRAYVAAGHHVTVLTQTGSGSDQSGDRWSSAGIRVVQLGAFPDTPAPQGLIDMVRHVFRYGQWIAAVDRWLSVEVVDMVHHISLSSIRLRWPSPPATASFVLGPVGGAHVPPLGGLLVRDILQESVRALSVPVLRHRARATSQGIALQTWCSRRMTRARGSQGRLG